MAIISLLDQLQKIKVSSTTNKWRRKRLPYVNTLKMTFALSIEQSFAQTLLYQKKQKVKEDILIPISILNKT